MPLVRITSPVGTGLPLPALTVTATVIACAVVMLVADGVTVRAGVTRATLTVPSPVAALKMGELVASGVYVANSPTLPGPSDSAGMLIVALPALSSVAADVYPPPVRTTDPVGVGLPLAAETVIVTPSACVVVMLEVEGVTVTTGVVGAFVTVTELAPVAELNVAEPAVSGV